MRGVLVFSALISLALGCNGPDPATIAVPPRPVPQTDAEIAFAKALFDDIQAQSIAEDREYCGLMGLDRTGRWVATEAQPGEEASCWVPSPDDVPFTTIASYHTHGSWNPDYFNEVPSFDDIRTDIEDGIDGYVATPGGRLWFIDARAKEARQICGRACLREDPTFEPNPQMPVASTYSLDALREF